MSASARPAGVIAYIGIGANLGDARATVRAAIAEIGRVPGVTDLQAASLYRTAPVESSGPDYVNTAVRVRTTLTPLALLRALQAIEQAHGRERPYRNAPRTLDLDVLLHGDAVIDTPELRVPHPRMLERAFVLAPLAELAPSLTVAGVSIRAALAGNPQRIRREDQQSLT
ncbi:2-amino-4-hydroxy-6-hydroxymethyldihydropteridine diphosphokinase [Verticiella sediminum]|uniref:2-amino-4-hydroxy-6-hydroxymethyldihydropteridine pyrophosphokinase n=1 Tax=Verticiella sediminum TaxID=1247510 RepID=A0A556AXB2_9BURK|nr:2-amino-4-hydroxy-6-hydroxymethyldihydropteridine diphosphokinase [Verticiella sediminum]TSH97588.1 2-amino-4-hydroxy-6-hydroxymethyldihydropteridine diphosphokinase [Verticiella sediminum]